MASRKRVRFAPEGGDGEQQHHEQREEAKIGGKGEIAGGAAEPPLKRARLLESEMSGNGKPEPALDSSALQAAARDAKARKALGGSEFSVDDTAVAGAGDDWGELAEEEVEGERDEGLSLAAAASGDGGEGEDGAPLEPFHLREDRADGYFDSGGFFIRRRFTADEQQDVDVWLAGVDAEGSAASSSSGDSGANAKSSGRSAALRKVAEAEERQQKEAERRRTEREQERALTSEAAASPVRLLTILVDALAAEDQTPAVAMRETKKKSAQPGSQTPAAGQPPTDDGAMKRLAVLTEACDALLGVSDYGNCYHVTRADLRARLLAALEQRAAERHLALPHIFWEYRVPPDGAVQGKFPTSHMLQWYAAGFFRPEQPCEIRRTSSSSDASGGNASASSSTGANVGAAAAASSDDEDIFDDVSEGEDDPPAAGPSLATSDSPWLAAQNCPLFSDAVDA
jgi:GYF domain